eukprot:1974078-Pleurochrysis_carterae.AAC.2
MGESNAQPACAAAISPPADRATSHSPHSSSPTLLRRGGSFMRDTHRKRLAADEEVGAQIFGLVAAEVEDDIAREDRRVQVSKQIGAWDDKPGTAVPAGPAPVRWNELDLAEGKKGIGGV